jgi:hypothetical protein
MSKKYWVVSPNVKNDPDTVEGRRKIENWRERSRQESAAFMGYGPNDYDGPQWQGHKFAGETDNGVKRGHVILIARQHKGKPDIVGFGVVSHDCGKPRHFQELPEDENVTQRDLSPFIPCSSAPEAIRIIKVLQRHCALHQFYPDENKYHKKVRDWMNRQLRINGGIGGENRRAIVELKNKRKLGLKSVVIVDPPKSYRGDYEVRTRKEKSKATKIEAGLVESYAHWLEKRGRKLRTITYNGRLQCDRYEEEGRNLIEAKASTSRENIRMAVGQLLDYAFLGKEEIRVPNMAILLPKKPDSDLVEWLQHLHISIIWREERSFRDNANGWFTAEKGNRSLSI